MSSKTAPRLKLSIGLATTAGFAWLLARETDLDAPARTFAGLSVSTVLLAPAFSAAGYALRVPGFRRRLRAPAMAVAGTLVVERILDVAVLTGVLFESPCTPWKHAL